MIKQIVKSHKIPTASPAGSYEARLELGVEVKKVVGYYVQVVANGGLTPETCLANLSNSSGTVFEPVGLGHLMVSSSVAIKDRFFREEPFLVDGYVNSKITTPAVTTSEAQIQFIFLVDTNK